MATGNHAHEWKYNEVKEITSLPSGQKKYTVIRFCLQCLEVEEVELSS
mgnify:CR=1 FL=1